MIGVTWRRWGMGGHGVYLFVLACRYVCANLHAGQSSKGRLLWYMGHMKRVLRTERRWHHLSNYL